MSKTATPSDAGAQGRSPRRWRLSLGRFAEDRMSSCFGGGACLVGADARVDQVLEHVYGRAYRQRGLSTDLSASRRTQKRSASLDPTAMTLPDWLSEMRELFPKSVREDIQGHAIGDFGMHEILSDKTALSEISPDAHLLATMLSLRDRSDPAVASLLRQLARHVVDDLMKRLKTRTTPALTGKRNRAAVTSNKGSARDIAWNATIRANLRNWNADRQRLIVDKIRFYRRSRRHLEWDVVLCVDQSGSMAPSLIHAAVMGAIFAGLPGVTVRFLAFDTAIVDLSDQVGDPVDLLLSVQLGGGTDIGQAVSYCEAKLIKVPTRTLFILVSDFYEGGPPAALVAAVKRLAEARVKLLGVAALDETGRADFDRKMAGRLAGVGMPISAVTPDRLADWVGEQLS